MEQFNVDLELERLEEDCSEQQEILDEAECKIDEIIGMRGDPEERQSYKEQWITMIKQEEEKSNKIRKTKQTFFGNLPKNEENIELQYDGGSRRQREGFNNRRRMNRGENYVE